MILGTIALDNRTPASRSDLMRKVRSKDTIPERSVRRLLHCSGYRFRLHRSELPGRPDVVFPSRRKAIFVHGCFWHRHANCPKASIPKSRLDYWIPKFERNVERDVTSLNALLQLGWRVLVVWQCEINDTNLLIARLCEFLGPPGRGALAKRPEYASVSGPGAHYRSW